MFSNYVRYFVFYCLKIKKFAIKFYLGSIYFVISFFKKSAIFFFE